MPPARRKFWEFGGLILNCQAEIIQLFQLFLPRDFDPFPPRHPRFFVEGEIPRGFPREGGEFLSPRKISPVVGEI